MTEAMLPAAPAKCVSTFQGRRSTSIAALLLSLAWAISEGLPGVWLFGDVLDNWPPTESLFVAAFLLSAPCASGLLIVTWCIVGPMPAKRSWEFLIAGAFLLAATVLIGDALLETLVIGWAWGLSAAGATSAVCIYGLGWQIIHEGNAEKRPISIWALLRITAVLALLAWVTRRFIGNDSEYLTTGEMLSIAFPVGAMAGIAMLLFLIIFAHRWRWPLFAVALSLAIPGSILLSRELSPLLLRGDYIVGAALITAFAAVAHMVLFIMPLLARGFRFARPRLTAPPSL